MKNHAKSYSINTQDETLDKHYTYFIKHSFRLIPKNYLGSVKNLDYNSLANIANFYQYNFLYANCLNIEETKISILSRICESLELGELSGKKLQCFYSKITHNFYEKNIENLPIGFIFLLESVPDAMMLTDTWISLLECFDEIIEFWYSKGHSFRIFYSRKQEIIQPLSFKLTKRINLPDINLFK